MLYAVFEFAWMLLGAVIVLALVVSNIKKSRTIKRLSGIWPSFGLSELQAIVNEAQQRFKQAYVAEQLLCLLKQVVLRLHITDKVQNDIIRSRATTREFLEAYEAQCADLLKQLESKELSAESRRLLDLRLKEFRELSGSALRGIARLSNWESFWQSLKT